MSRRVISEIMLQEEISPKHFKMVIKAPKIAKQAKAGQFLHLKWVSNLHDSDPLLRRPISINEINREEGTITIIYRVIGRGTRALANLVAGDKVDIMGPIGMGFSIPDFVDRAVIIGGGMGIAPLFPIVKELVAEGKEVVVLLGSETKGQLLNLVDYKKLDVKLKTATVDGSYGYKGFVTDLLDDELEDADYLYTCGPEVMMEVVQEKVISKGLAGEASLEERMGCGTGACLSCVCKNKVKNQDGWEYKKTCTQGPVFSLEEVIFRD